jgi:nitrile hydratase accessory protein
LSRPEPSSGAEAGIERVSAELAPILRGEDGAPVFRAPWEARAFALTLALYERGLFTWSEWTQVLSEEIRSAETQGDRGDGSTYYRHWLAAIERLVTAKGLTSQAALAQRRAAWDHPDARRRGDPSGE